ncbi:MAG: DNA translocase FtsK 4TM domain-containing protein [Hyphomicrobium sp.]
MIDSRFSGLPQQPLFPATLEDRLVRLLGRASGYLLLAVIAALWLSLLTWALTDPSLTHATGGPARNALGPLGAVLSDLMLQMLGFATALALLAPMLWGLELVLGERIVRFRSKAAFFPLSVLLLAGALSSLPVPSAWPLHHGLGGILGDAVFNMAANIFSLINPERAAAAAGLLFFISGASAMMYSVGLELKDLVALTRRSPYDTSGSWSDNLWAEAQRLRSTLGGLQMARPAEPRFDADRRMPDARRASPASPHGPRPAPHAHARDVSARDGGAQAFAAGDDHDDRPAVAAGGWMPAAGSAAGALPGVLHRAEGLHQDEETQDFEDAGAEFDARTEKASRSIAARFAPAAGDAPALRKIPGSSFLRSLKPRDRTAEPTNLKRPSLNLLKRPPAQRPSAEFTQTMLRGNARLLEDVLADFGVKGEIKEIRPGPVVTLFEFEPVRGTKSSRVISLADDIARSMSAVSVRVAVVPGRNAIGIELPNPRREGVLLRELLESDAFRGSECLLPLALGKSIGGEPVIADLARMPHVLVAGTTGSGKSVGINAFVLSLLYRHTPEDCRLLMIDPKMLELSVYNGIPHLLTPVVTEPQKAVAALNWAVQEMDERYKRMAKLSVRSIDVFNNRVRNANKRGELIARTVQTGFDSRTGEAVYERQEMDLAPMPYIVVVVDEFADLMVVAGKEIEQAVQRLAQMARAAGIHLIMATQRPSVDVVTGTIKANFPTRISFKVASKVDSRTILNDQGAEQLLGQGDMLFSGGSGQIVRVHGPFVSDEEVDQIAQFLREQGPTRYLEGITDTASAGSDVAADSAARASGDDDLYDRAVAIVMRDRRASTSYIQRRLGIGYNRAADLIERMQREGVVTAATTAGKRDVVGGASDGRGA